MWPAYAAAVWAFVFAVRGVYWATGGTVGLGTLSLQLQELAAAGDRDTRIALWVAVVLLLVGTAWALAFARGWRPALPPGLPMLGGRRIPELLLVPGAGAAGVLIVHGSAYVSGLLFGDRDQAATWWYGLLWGPWFVLGGVLFLLAADSYRRRVLPGRRGAILLGSGLAGGMVLAVAPVVIGMLVTAPA